MIKRRAAGAGALLPRLLPRIPAFQALLGQAISFVIVLVVAFALSSVADAGMPVAIAALLQGLFAALAARRMDMDAWWIPIQLLFPVSLVALLAVSLPSWIYLAAFTVMLCLYWSTFRTRVPYYPSSPSVREAVLAQLPADRALSVIDIGSGFGGLALHVAHRRPDCAVSGIELAPLPWLCSSLRASLRGSAARFIRGDYMRLDFGSYDVVFAYLSPAAMPSLWGKAHAEMRDGALLLSNEFAVPGVEPDLVLHPAEGGPALYGWHVRRA